MSPPELDCIFFVLLQQKYEIIYRWEIGKDSGFSHLPGGYWNYASELGTKHGLPSVLGPTTLIVLDLSKHEPDLRIGLWCSQRP